MPFLVRWWTPSHECARTIGGESGVERSDGCLRRPLDQRRAERIAYATAPDIARREKASRMRAGAIRVCANHIIRQRGVAGESVPRLVRNQAGCVAGVGPSNQLIMLAPAVGLISGDEFIARDLDFQQFFCQRRCRRSTGIDAARRAHCAKCSACRPSARMMRGA